MVSLASLSYIPKQIPSQRERGKESEGENKRCLRPTESKRAPLFPNKFSTLKEDGLLLSPFRCASGYPRSHRSTLHVRIRSPSFKVVLKCHRAHSLESGRRQSTRLISSVVSVNYNETNGCRNEARPHTRPS